ncbi:MAG: GHKL domain-containing protein [Labilithrix sp.]|nr:GHKL domain-containing protein [Labilithrix sp.]
MKSRVDGLWERLRLTHEDARRLALVREQVSAQLPALAERLCDDVYDRRDEARLVTLRSAHAEWLEGLFVVRHERARADRVGRAHLVAGAPLSDLFVALAEIRAELEGAADAADPTHETARALSRILDAELAAMVETYLAEQSAAHRRDDRQARLASLGSLAAGLAHEIRNPLNGALLNVSFVSRALEGAGASHDVREALHVVKDEVKRLASLVTDFLEFALPRPIALEPTSLRAIGERAVTLVASQLGADAKLRAELPPPDVVVPADEPRLVSAVVNLLENAIEAVGARGNVTLRVRRDAGQALIDVEDDGPGVPEGDLRIFEPFHSTKPHGTGLGLAVAQRAVADHGGTIEVDSEPGRTRFRVALPLASSGEEG